LAPTAIPTAGATATPLVSPGNPYRMRVIRRVAARGLGDLRLVRRNATATSLGLRACLSDQAFSDSMRRDFVFALRRVDGARLQGLKVRRNSSCRQLTVRRRGSYRVRFEQVRDDSVMKTSEEVFLEVR
jgi:hypothetical protein